MLPALMHGVEIILFTKKGIDKAAKAEISEQY